MKKLYVVLVMIVIIAAMVLPGCQPPPPPTAPPAPEKDKATPSAPATPAPAPGPGTTPSPTVPAALVTPAPEVPSKFAHLTPNPVETSKPVYGGTLKYAAGMSSNFDGHLKKGWWPMTGLPIFNQLLSYDLAYRDTLPENIIGDLAERWEVSEDGTEITFYLHQGVAWHDGQPFSADDVIYSVEKMMDPERSNIDGFFPAYESVEKIDANTVKINLTRASAGFIIALAGGYAVMQPKHLAGTDPETTDFAVGTGPFTLVYYDLGEHIVYQRNPDYFKKDQYGNQLPYLDGIENTNPAGQPNEKLVDKQIDIKGPVSWLLNLSSYQMVSTGAPEVKYALKSTDRETVMFLNMERWYLQDIRVRRALALMIDQEALVTAFSGHVMFGDTDIGVLQRSFGLPSEEVVSLMGWDQPFEARLAEAKRLLAEAVGENQIKLDMLSRVSTSAGPDASASGANKAFAALLEEHLGIEVEITSLVSASEVTARVKAGDYDIYTAALDVEQNPVAIGDYFGSRGVNNWSHYDNIKMDLMLDEIDAILDPTERREHIWKIERKLLTDLPALPTGAITTSHVPYWPYVKNFRMMNMSYTNICSLEDVWLDPVIYQQIHGKALVTGQVMIPGGGGTDAPAVAAVPAGTSGKVTWVSVAPPLAAPGDEITVVLKVPAGAKCEIIYIMSSDTRSSFKPDPVTADTGGNASVIWKSSEHTTTGEGTLELTITETEGTVTIETQPYAFD